MGKPGVANLDVYRGDTFTLALRFWIDSTKTAGIDVSARTFTAQIREYVGAPTAITMAVDMTHAAPSPSSNPGVVVFTVDSTTTGTIAWDVGGYDIQQVVGGVTTTIVAGSVTVGGEFTHA